MVTVKPFAFVLMPFDGAFDDIYKLGIKAVADELGIVAERVDEQNYSETILERIYRQIDVADFIIADMTGRNSNVFYEVGYAHAKEKLCTLLTQETGDIPFDLKHHRHLVYGGSIQTLKQKLSEEISWAKDEIARKNTEIISVLLKSVEGLLVKNTYSAIGEIEITFDIHNRTDRRTPEIEAMYLYTGGQWKFEQGGEECASTKPDEPNFGLRHFVKIPVSRLSPNAWAPIKLKGKKQLWSKFSGDEVQDSYRIKGLTKFEIATSEGNFIYDFNIDVELDEIPF